MQLFKTFKTFFITLFLFVSLLPAQQAVANEGAKEGESAYIKLEPFTVNLAGLTQYLQVELALQAGSPEVGATIANLKPKVRHEMILLLSSQEAAQILTPEGKVKLAADIRHAINDAIEMPGKHGVTGVLFVSFIVQ